MYFKQRKGRNFKRRRTQSICFRRRENFIFFEKLTEFFFFFFLQLEKIFNFAKKRKCIFSAKERILFFLRSERIFYFCKTETSTTEFAEEIFKALTQTLLFNKLKFGFSILINKLHFPEKFKSH